MVNLVGVSACRSLVSQLISWCFNNPSRFNTIGTGHYFFNLARFCGRSDPLQVWIKAPFSKIMGMAHMMTGHRFFSTNLTYFRHGVTPLGNNWLKIINRIDPIYWKLINLSFSRAS